MPKPDLHEEATKRYLGDGVYASYDGYHIWLRIGPDPTRPFGAAIALEPPVLKQLIAYSNNIPLMMAEADRIRAENSAKGGEG